MNLNKDLGKKKIENMLPTNVCMFHKLSETIFTFYFLVCVVCILTYFHSCTGSFPFIFNFIHTFSKVKFPPSSGRQVLLIAVNKPDV